MGRTSVNAPRDLQSDQVDLSPTHGIMGELGLEETVVDVLPELESLQVDQVAHRGRVGVGRELGRSSP